MIDKMTYNRDISRVCRFLPLASTVVGAARICGHSVSLITHLALSTKLKIQAIFLKETTPAYYRKGSEAALHVLQMRIDLREIIHGIIQLPPLLGTLSSYLWDCYCLSPAQKLAYRIQEIYATRLQADTDLLKDPNLTDVDVTDKNYSSEFIDFINGKKVKMSADQAKIDELERAFIGGECDHSIFNDKKLPFYALAAFSQNKIDRQDISTLLEFYTAKQCFPDCQLQHLSQLSEEDAISIFGEKIGMLEDPAAGLVAYEACRTLPDHKQYVWSYECLAPKGKISVFQRQELLMAPVGSLYMALMDIVGIKNHEDREYTHSFDMERIITNCKYGKSNNYLKVKLGEFTPMQIKQAVMNDSQRLCATFFPGLNPMKEIHESLELPTTIIMHDKSHGEILQHCPSQAESDIKRFVHTFEETTKAKMSKEIWELIEMVAPSSFKEDDLFLDSFFRDCATKADEIFIKELFYKDSGEPSLLYWIICLDFLSNLSEYQSKIPLVRIFPEYYRKIVKSLDANLTKNQKLWTLLNPQQTIPKDEELEFRRVKKGLRKNTIVLVLKNSPFDNTVAIKKK